MAQIIKHRRGSIGSLKDVTANVGELVMATGSIGDLNAPVLFIGESAVAGGYKPVSKIYQGAAVPVLGASYGSTMDGTPFYSNNNKTLYILDRNGNIDMDFTGNIEGNTISGVTINSLTSSFVSASNTVYAATGSFGQIQVSNISFTGLTEGRVSLVGPGGSIVDSGSLNFNDGELGISGSIKLNTDAYIYNDGALYVEDHTNGVQVQSNNWVDLQSNNNFVYLESGYTEIYSEGNTDIYGEQAINIYSQNGDVAISSYSGHTLYLNNDGGEGNINLGNYVNNVYGYTTITNLIGSNYAQLESSGSFVWVEAIGAHLQNDSGSAGVGFTARPNGIIEATGSLHVYGNTQISGNTSMTGSLIVSNGAAIIDQGVISQNSNVLLTSGSNLIIQDGGNANIAGNVYITGSEYVDNIYTRTGYAANALHLNGGTYGAPDVELTSTYNISLFAEGGTINVTGSMKVTGDVTVEQNMYVSGNIYQTGSFYTQGDIVLSGSINIGDNIGVDTINFQGEVSSSILPKISNVFDLGGPSNYWHDLYVSGTAHINILQANTISLDGITVFNDLIVSGSSYLGLGGGDQVIVSGSIYNDALTEKRMVVVGAQGLLTDYSGLTFDNGNLNLSGALEVTNIQGTGSLYLQPDKNDVRLFEIYNTAGGGGTDIHFKGNADYNYFGGDINYLKLDDVAGYTTLIGNSGVTINSNSGNVNISSYDNSDLNLNNDGGEGDINIGNNSNSIYGYSTNTNLIGSNYAQLESNNSYLWVDSDGAYVHNSNTGTAGFTARPNGIIEATGSLHVYGNTQISGNTAMTGSLIVSNAAGVFNSSLIVNNSDLTLDGGTNQHMNDGAHLYFDTCVDMYYDGGSNNFVFYNDCNAFSFQNNVSITGSINVSNGINTDNIYGVTTSSNALHLNGGTYDAPDVELTSYGQISLFSEGGYGTSNYAINMTGSVHMMDSLDVTGSATFISGVTFGMAPTITGLTDNRVVIVGTGGLLEDDANFTFDGVTFKIGDGDFEIDVTSGDTRTSGSLLVKNGATVTGSFKLHDSATNFSIVGNGFSQTYFQGNGALVWNPGYGGMEVVGTDAHLKVNDYLNVGNGAGITGSLGVSGSANISGGASVTGAFTVGSGSMTSLGGNLYVSGNLEVLGSSTNVSLESHTVNIGDNIILVNAYSPFQRYAGIAAYDSGSSGVSGSLLWDSLSDYWMFVSSSNQTSKLVGTTTGTYGSETNLTSGTFPIADGDNTIGDSLLTFSGTTLAFNNNKFTVDSDSGNTYISGNVTVDTGGSDLGTETSWVTFRNDDNVLGFVDSNDTKDVTTQLLGYDESDGTLKFSSLIDGGTY